MTSYQTPEPIDIAIDLPFGRLDVIASDRADTVVTVEPSNPGRAQDVRGAQETKVQFDGGRVTIAAPRRFSLIGPSESIDIRVEAPAGSRLTADLSGPVRATGRLGATRIKASLGPVDLDTTADLQVDAAHGGVTVRAVEGHADIKASHGSVRFGSVSGDALVKALHGNILVEQSGTAFDASLSYGDLEVERATGTVIAKTSFGRVRIGAASSGSIRMETGFGELSVGVPDGVAVWLDAVSKLGRVRNDLDTDRAPEPGEPTLEVRARTEGGDILIHRAR
jgi:hypothetical protein